MAIEKYNNYVWSENVKYDIIVDDKEIQNLINVNLL